MIRDILLLLFQRKRELNNLGTTAVDLLLA